MGHLTIDKFVRLIDRAVQIRANPECHPTVAAFFDDVLAAPATEFRTAHLAEISAQSACNRARRASAEALAAVDVHHKVTRAVIAGRFPGTVLPGTLKAKPTDTDRKIALEDLLAHLLSRRGEPWADNIVAGPFGPLAADAAAKVAAVDTATSALAVAGGQRSLAMQAAYAPFLSFKEAVRHAHGSGSDLYRRLRIRTHAATVAEPPPPPVVAAPSSTVALEHEATAASPTNGAH